MQSSPRIRKHFTIQESDVTIISDSETYIPVAIKCLKQERAILEDIIINDSIFKSSFSPYFSGNTSNIIKRMENAGMLANVGPMASVAGVLADLMCECMIAKGAQIAVVENGGEIMIHSTEDIYIGLYSHTTQLKDKIGFIFKGGSIPLGVGTSSGTFGHATSLGEADTVTVFAPTAGIADAVATKIANSIKRNGDNCILEPALRIADSLECISGMFITCGDKVAKTGSIPELVFSQ